jgi:alkylation response protein AidB-like acyl-CoA dehydrogenase
VQALAIEADSCAGLPLLEQSRVETLRAPIVTARQAWCPLFSEPSAGSDLAALTTATRLDGEESSLAEDVGCGSAPRGHGGRAGA